MEEIMRDMRGLRLELAEFNGEANHVHLLVKLPPAMAISHLVKSLKGVSSRRQDPRNWHSTYWRANGYGPGCTSPTRSTVPHLDPAPVHRTAEQAPPDGFMSVRHHHQPEDRRRY
jgi:REP element-mobilizing transposase RayT